MDGILLVNKEKNKTSRDVINELNKIFNTKKIGHTGTLDPIATGVLVCCLGKYTKLVNDLTALDKEYIATIKLGIKTDTADISGEIIERKDFNIDKNDILEVFENLIGKYMQTVPRYSAVKINGKKLYEYARSNIDIELPKRLVNIYSLELLEFDKDIIKFKTRVSKGTYIRSLIEDICEELMTVGTMNSLERISQGQFKIENCFSLEDIKNKEFRLINVREIFDYPIIELNEEEYFLVKNGVKIDNKYNIKDKVIFLYNKKEVAIYINEDNILKNYIHLI